MGAPHTPRLHPHILSHHHVLRWLNDGGLIGSAWPMEKQTGSLWAPSWYHLSTGTKLALDSVWEERGMCSISDLAHLRTAQIRMF